MSRYTPRITRSVAAQAASRPPPLSGPVLLSAEPELLPTFRAQLPVSFGHSRPQCIQPLISLLIAWKRFSEASLLLIPLGCRAPFRRSQPQPLPIKIGSEVNNAPSGSVRAVSPPLKLNRHNEKRLGASGGVCGGVNGGVNLVVSRFTPRSEPNAKTPEKCFYYVVSDYSGVPVANKCTRSRGSVQPQKRDANPLIDCR